MLTAHLDLEQAVQMPSFGANLARRLFPAEVIHETIPAMTTTKTHMPALMQQIHLQRSLVRLADVLV